MTQPSVGELMTQLTAQTSRLVRDEMRLARSEITESVRHAARGAGLISAAGLLGFLGAGTLVAAVVAALALALPVWAAALIVAAVLLGAAAVVAVLSRREAQRVSPPAPQTVSDVKADVRTVQEGISHARHATR